MLVVIERASGGVIGMSRYSRDKAHPDEIEIGSTFLARRYWGCAYNGEMKQLMLEHAFRFVERAIFLIGEDNIRSRRAIEKLGARLTDRIFPAEINGNRIVHLIYAIDTDAPSPRGGV